MMWRSDVSEPVLKARAEPMVSYVARKARHGEPVFLDIALPDGTIVRRIDQDVHERALKRVSDKYRDQTE